MPFRRQTAIERAHASHRIHVRESAMPRNELRKMDGIRQRFTARIVRRGERPGWHSPRPTLLLADVADAETGRQLTDHLWIDDGIWSKAIPDGSAIAFDARVGEYLKGYFGRREDAWDAPPPSLDWKVRRPTKVRIFNPDTGEWTAPAKAASPAQGMATAAQIRYLGILQAQTGQPALTPADGLTKGQAAALIDNLTAASASKPTPRQLEYLAALRQAAGQPALTPDADLTKDQVGDLITELVANTPRPQCAGTTLAGHRCRNLVGYTEQYCGSHSAAAEEQKASRPARAVRIPANRCQATTRAGAQCKRPASGSNGFCLPHEPPPPRPPPRQAVGQQRCQGCGKTARRGRQFCRQCARQSHASD